MKGLLVAMVLFVSYSAIADVKFLIGKTSPYTLFFEVLEEKTIAVKKIEFQKEGLYVETSDTSTSLILFPKNVGLSTKELADLILTNGGNGKALRVYVTKGHGIGAEVMRTELIVRP